MQKGTLRVGYPTSDPRGAYEVLCCWLHVGCSSELFTLLLQGEAQPQQLEQLREDLIVSLSTLDYTAAAAAAGAAANTPKAEGGDGISQALAKEEPTPCKEEKQEGRKTRVSAQGRRGREADKAGNKEDAKESISIASTTTPGSGGPSTASASSTPDDASGEPRGPKGELASSGTSAKDEEAKQLSLQERLMLERAGCIVSLDLLCLAEEGLSSSEQREVDAAIAAAARRLFFPSDEKEEKAAAEEVLEGLTKRAIAGRLPSPPGLQLPLLPFQEEGLWWLAQQEASDIRGGILADEMGKQQQQQPHPGMFLIHSF